jgi:hypothetical protein
MKLTLTILFIICFLSSNGQSLQQIDKDLSQAFAKIEYWNEYDDAKDNVAKDDSLQAALAGFEKQLIHYTSTVPQTLDYSFDSLDKKGINIITSEDGLFRIYSWYQYNGGTMHFYKNIFQYRNAKGTFAYISDTTKADQDFDPGCFYRQINKIVSQQKTYYITLNTSVGSSALTYHTVKIFSIEDYGLNDTAKLIKTRTGIRNELGYEMDFSTTSNRNIIRTDINYSTEYDPAKKIITIPLIEEDGKLTARKIRYRFDGKYFVRM